MCLMCRPGRLTVNIGDGLTRWTDGIYKSTYHRVRAPKAGDPTVREAAPSSGECCCGCTLSACKPARIPAGDPYTHI